MNKENLKDISFVFSDGPGKTAFLAWLRGWYGSTSLRNQKQKFSLHSRIFTVALRYFLIQSCNIKAATGVPKLHLALNGITFFRIKRKIVSEYFSEGPNKAHHHHRKTEYMLYTQLKVYCFMVLNAGRWLERWGID